MLFHLILSHQTLVNKKINWTCPTATNFDYGKLFLNMNMGYNDYWTGISS